MLTPDLFIKNDDMCVIFGRNKKFQHTNLAKGWNFLFWDDDESVEEYPDDFITAGNYCHQLRSDAFIVRPLNESYRRRNRR